MNLFKRLNACTNPVCGYTSEVPFMACPRCGRALMMEYNRETGNVQNAYYVQVFNPKMRWVISAVVVVILFWAVIVILFAFAR